MNKENLKPVKLAICASFTSEPADPYIKWWGVRFGYHIEVAFSPEKEVIRELSDNSSVMSTNEGVNLLLVRFEDCIRGDDSSDLKKTGKMQKYFTELTKILKSKPKPVPYFIGILPVSTDISLNPDVREFLQDLYNRWQKSLKKMENVFPIDLTRLKILYEIETIFDSNLDQDKRLPFSLEFYAAMGTSIARKICAYSKSHFKVIVLDCDNTMWKGIVGEDGPLGVKVDGPFQELHKFMIQKYNQGFLLAMCSKNNEPDVWEVFDKNPGMLLKKEHFVDWRINWKTKSSNINDMAKELNLGIDSFIFVDDNPVECAEVMTDNPNILSLRFPKNYDSIPIWLEHVWAFDKLKITEEDKMRTEMYRAEKNRMALQSDSQSLNDFLASLELKVSMNTLKPEQISRVAQLTQRTNQFNLSTRRRNEDDILKLEKEPGTLIWVIEIFDKFGEYGIVGVVITKKSDETLFLDTLLLSCRALGRGVEMAMLAGLRKYCGDNNLKTMEAPYYPTSKNKPLLGFLEEKWVKKSEMEDHTLFTYVFDKTSESIGYVDFYYLKDYEKETVDSKNVDSKDTIEGDEEKNQAVTDAVDSVTHYRWEVEKMNTENLMHIQYLLPLENHTARDIIRLTKLEG